MEKDYLSIHIDDLTEEKQKEIGEENCKKFREHDYPIVTVYFETDFGGRPFGEYRNQSAFKIDLEDLNMKGFLKVRSEIIKRNAWGIIEPLDVTSPEEGLKFIAFAEDLLSICSTCKGKGKCLDKNKERIHECDFSKFKEYNDWPEDSPYAEYSIPFRTGTVIRTPENKVRILQEWR